MISIRFSCALIEVSTSILRLILGFFGNAQKTGQNFVFRYIDKGFIHLYTLIGYWFIKVFEIDTRNDVIEFPAVALCFYLFRLYFYFRLEIVVENTFCIYAICRKLDLHFLRFIDCPCLNEMDRNYYKDAQSKHSARLKSIGYYCDNRWLWAAVMGRNSWRACRKYSPRIQFARRDIKSKRLNSESNAVKCWYSNSIIFYNHITIRTYGWAHLSRDENDRKLMRTQSLRALMIYLFTEPTLVRKST